MQVAELSQQIESAFEQVGAPPADQLLAPRYADAIDPGELRAAFEDKHWRDVTPRELFLHRESLSALSAVGFQAYVAAYLIASLDGEEADDLVEYTLFALHPLTSEPADAAESRERLSLLDGAQRAAIRAYLQHVAPTDARASNILRHWA